MEGFIHKPNGIYSSLLIRCTCNTYSYQVLFNSQSAPIQLLQNQVMNRFTYGIIQPIEKKSTRLRTEVDRDGDSRW